ncbi:alpha/beta fold hydrolase [Luteimonas aquatica]|uniref:alpha/beta fold hydrolase n=1 Tax=Luteimonas aquatica TaxID=450364 RepID=UPI001F593119|nr:alpha/beta fold hydrolase [Luteimonas aquatica]
MAADDGLGHGTAAIAPLAMRDGAALFRREWPLPLARRAVLLVHGLGEHSGRYAALARWFNQRGYAVRAYDQRGHGHSPGRRGAIARPEALLEDLAEVYRDYAAALGFAPLLLGHSMGGLVALRTVLDGRIAPPLLALSSPLLRAHEPRWLQGLAGRLAPWLPNLPLRAGLRADRLSHDPAVGLGYRRDPLRHGWITPRLADFLFRAAPACVADAATLRVPTLLLYAGDDFLVDARGSRDFAAAAPPALLTAQAFDALYHELFNETDPGRGEVLAALETWLAARDADPAR